MRLTGKFIFFLKQEKNSNGFSLMELVLVIAIAGILAAVIVPHVDGLITGVRLRGALDRLRGTLRYAAGYAFAHHDTVWVHIDSTENSFQLFTGPTIANREPLKNPVTQDTSAWDMDEEFPGIKLTVINLNGSADLSFNIWGQPNRGGRLELNHTRSIKIEPETGYVHGVD